MSYEEMRLLYKPTPIKILMIADAPPRPNTHFFYDHTAKDPLRKFCIKAFKEALPSQAFSDELLFLKFFKENGFYLDDLCHVSLHDFKKPINENAIERIRTDGKKLLANRLCQFQAESPLCAIISISMEIKHYVDLAIATSNLPDSVLTYNLVFPSQWPKQQRTFVTTLTEKLQDLKKRQII